MRLLLYAVEDDPGPDALRELAASGGGEVEEYLQPLRNEGCELAAVVQDGNVYLLLQRPA